MASQSANTRHLCAKRQRDEHARAERLMLGALEALLNNWNFDISFINQRDLVAKSLLRGGRLDVDAVSEFADAVRKEFGERA